MSKYVWLFGLAVLGLGVWAEYEQRTNPAPRDRKYMLCQTALACAKYIEMSLRTELDQGAADFSGVSREGTVVIVEYDLKSVRSDFFNGEVEDGRTLEKWGEDELVVPLRADACRELDHRDFVRMGGRVIHRYRFSDGEVFREVVIDRCQ